MDPTDLLPGTRVGTYVVRRRIGSGGMGVVYEAEDPRIGRRAAIKILRPDQDSARGLLEEARSANAVRHRGIVDVYGYGELPGIGQYLVMEYLDGRPLDEVLHAHRAMSVADALPILDEVLAALDAAHSKGVIHRDLKPSNIFLIDEPGGARYVKLLDFGLAKRATAPHAVTKQTSQNGVVGTPHYMAPEQAMGLEVGPKTDLYAVGVIAFELLTGDVPFDGATPMEIAVKQVNDAPPDLSSRPDVPPALSRTVAELLAKDPEQRPSAQAVRQTLRRIQRELAAAATRVGHAPVPLRAMTAPGLELRPTVRVGKSTVRWAVIGAAALVVVAGAFVLGRRNHHPRAAVVAAQQSVPPVMVQASPPASVAAPTPVAAEEPAPVETAPVQTVRPAAEVRRPRPAPAPRAGMLTVLVVGGIRADVFVDGKKAGSTPLSEFKTTAGRHRVRLSLPNGVTHEQHVNVPAGQNLRVTKRWDAAAGALKEL